MWVYEKKVLYTSCTYRKNGDMKEKAYCATHNPKAVKLSYVQLYISAKKRYKNQEHNHNPIKLIQSYRIQLCLKNLLYCAKCLK